MMSDDQHQVSSQKQGELLVDTPEGFQRAQMHQQGRWYVHVLHLIVGVLVIICSWQAYEIHTERAKMKRDLQESELLINDMYEQFDIDRKVELETMPDLLREYLELMRAITAGL